MTSGEQEPKQLARPTLTPVLSGLAGGFVIAAIVCVGLGWLHRTPNVPLAEDVSSVTSILWRTSLVVASAALLVAVFVALGRIFQTSVRLRRFAAFAAPVLAVITVAGFMAKSRGGAAKAFDAAADAQLALHPFAVTTVTHWAWWFSCLAVGTLALRAFVDYGEARDELLSSEPVRWVALGVALVLAVVCVVPVVLSARKSPFNYQTAERIDAPVLTELRGDVAYRAQVSSRSDYVRPGGAGWVQIGGGSDGESVGGFDGETGQRRWFFTMPRFNVGSLRTTGTGPDSVVLVKAYIPTDSLIALDATTGALLWARPDDTTFDDNYPLSSSVLLSSGDTADGGKEWRALSVRTGEVLWSKVFRPGCTVSMDATANTILLRTCDDGPDVVTAVLDPKTGEPTGVITMAGLGITPGQKPRVVSTAGDRALIGDIVVDIPTGRPLAHIPDRQNASFIDSESLKLTLQNRSYKEAPPISILDLRDGRIIDPGLFQAWADRAIARVGDQWLTLLPDAQALSQLRSESKSVRPPMRIIGKSGLVRVLPFPCEGDYQLTPQVSYVPGAVQVSCGTDVVAAIR